ncbi:MAG: DUF2093 domain-containing protein [Sphingomonadaceae bacterium]
MLMANRSGPARLRYLPGRFKVVAPGDYVLCAVTGRPIPLEELRYWNVERQEAYSSAEVSTAAEKGA